EPADTRAQADTFTFNRLGIDRNLLDTHRVLSIAAARELQAGSALACRGMFYQQNLAGRYGSRRVQRSGRPAVLFHRGRHNGRGWWTRHLLRTYTPTYSDP